MTNYKKKFIKELQDEISSAKLCIAQTEARIKIHLPQAIKELELKIVNLKELLEAVKANDSFSEPIFSYENNEEDYD